MNISYHLYHYKLVVFDGVPYALARNPLDAPGSDQPDNILTFPNHAATVRAPHPQFLGKLGQSGHYAGAKKDGYHLVAKKWTGQWLSKCLSQSHHTYLGGTGWSLSPALRTDLGNSH